MLSGVDLSRAVPLRIVDDLPDRDPATPGDAQPLVGADRAPAGFLIGCPGCGAQLSLPIGPRPDRPAWAVLAGDPRTGAGLSLQPSIHHAEPQGCGWHGHLTEGRFTPL